MPNKYSLPHPITLFCAHSRGCESGRSSGSPSRVGKVGAIAAWQVSMAVSNTFPEITCVEHIASATHVRKWTLIDGVVIQNHILKFCGNDDSVKVYTALPIVLVSLNNFNKWAKHINSVRCSRLKNVQVVAISTFGSRKAWWVWRAAPLTGGGVLWGLIIYG